MSPEECTDLARPDTAFEFQVHAGATKLLPQKYIYKYRYIGDLLNHVLSMYIYIYVYILCGLYMYI